MSVFDRRCETMPRAELEQLQLERLQALLARLKRNVRRYREKIGDLRVESLAGLARLPFTTPEDMADSFPYGLFAFPMREIIRLRTTVGPEGRPLVIGHTRNDLTLWGRLVARQLCAAGVTANDVIQMGFGGGVYGAAGWLFGAQVVEASVIAEDPTHFDYQLAMLRNYRPTVLITTPGNALRLMRILEEKGIDPQSLHLSTVVLSRPVDGPTREQLRGGLFGAVHASFGVSEILDPGFCVECEHGQFHANEDHFLVEAHEGELVVTTLCREAMPLLRYRTRVACELARERCACGRAGAVLKPGARLDRRLLANETPFYESQIAGVLAHTRAASHRFEIGISDRGLTVSIEMTAALFASSVWSLEVLKHELEAEFLARLGIPASVRFSNPPPTGTGARAE